MIPALTRGTGLLPPGIHDADWSEVVKTFGDSPKRNQLIVGLQAACQQLRNAGAKYLYLDGSFVTAKRSPGDWDACYSREGIDGSKLDPVFLDFSDERKAQKAKYLGEAFVAETKSGILGPPFLEFFQTERLSGRKKGIVRLNLASVP
jgi:hypothetical protein